MANDEIFGLVDSFWRAKVQQHNAETMELDIGPLDAMAHRVSPQAGACHRDGEVGR